MSGQMTRSISMSPVEATGPDFPEVSPLPSSHGSPKISAENSSRRMYQDSQANSNSPLKIFVLAKKKINDIFNTIGKYVKESSSFLNSVGVDQNIIDSLQLEEAIKYNDRVNSIKEVLARDHMKVAFFGRTSNGKSTVINGMLGEKILPSGIGHTTNCFLQVEGSETGDAYLLTEDSKEPKNVASCAQSGDTAWSAGMGTSSVGQLGHALCAEKLSESSLVRIFWPKEKCPLLRDDVVFVDSPGVDVSPNLDEWIDKHCLDADVFVLVANAESTLMTTEKKFFHKVSEKLSKPNVFILNNRWDASAGEPEICEEVRKQHMERNVSFLVDELHVASKNEVEDRVFFVSAKEVLQARLSQQPAVVADGFQKRYFEFQNFEKKFEVRIRIGRIYNENIQPLAILRMFNIFSQECISKSAVKTKFEQHTEQGKAIAHALKDLMNGVHENAIKKKLDCTQQRKEIADKLDFTDQQLNILTQEMKDRIVQIMEQVEQKVSSGLNEEIRRLHVLIDEFEHPFHSDTSLLNLYKRELHKHIECGLGRASQKKLNDLKRDTTSSFDLIIISQGKVSRVVTAAERMTPLLSHEQQQQVLNVLPHRDFEVYYRLNCDNLCADFQENIEFHFSLGLSSVIHRLFPPYSGRRKFSAVDCKSAPLTPMTPVTERQFPATNVDYWALIQRIAVVSPASQTALGAMALGGFLGRTVGWRPIAVGAGLYGLLFLYEKLTWTNKAKERCLKKQYVKHATKKLRLVVDLTSANCSHQVQQELSSTFARLCHLVDEGKSQMVSDLRDLDGNISKLQTVTNNSKIFRNKAGYLISELDTFTNQYLQYND
ncbi:Transmembrane GTPase Marf [Nymphon striatum]|nr:Transmembrane GTPase Marf [Nymphon striatum]